MSIIVSYNLKQIAQKNARAMRLNPTKAEFMLWQSIRKRQFYNLKFLRQHPIYFDFLGTTNFYIADFFCFEKKIVIEVDGRIHNYTKQRDKQRDEIMRQLGLRVIRFKNEEVLYKQNDVLSKLHEFIFCKQKN